MGTLRHGATLPALLARPGTMTEPATEGSRARMVGLKRPSPMRGNQGSLDTWLMPGVAQEA